ncbi:MAG: hypothetical protein SGPRY_012221, partial [Prymnesium sp.]
IDCFSDLVPDRPQTDNKEATSNILLVLVDKGRLGDTFPETFQCMDMRARPNIKYLETMVQELGRLCRYGRDGILPYALVCKDLGEHLQGKASLDELAKAKAAADEVDQLIKRRGTKASIRESTTSFLTYLRRNSKAALAAAAAGAVPKGLTRPNASYDAGRAESESLLSFSEESPNIGPRWHQRRFVLFGEPQIGKTAAFVSCIAKLRKLVSQHVETQVEVDDGSDSDSPEELCPLPAEGYPSKVHLEKIIFTHNKTKPDNGAYGDPACDEVWNHYQNGKRPDELSEELLTSDAVGGKGGRGVKQKSRSIPNVASAAGSSSQICVETQECIPYRVMVQSCDGHCKRVQVPVDFQGREGMLHIIEEDEQIWDTSTKGAPKLAIPKTTTYCQLPIFMPSTRGSDNALLGISSHFIEQTYVQVVCIYPEMLDSYKKCAGASLFVYPFDSVNDVRCVGYSRHWVHRLACKVCTPHQKGGCFYVMHDDNIKAWWKVNLNEGSTTPVRLFDVLQYIERGLGWHDDTAAEGMREIAMFGFHGRQKRKLESKESLSKRSPHGNRSHCMKVVIMNIDLLSKYDFRPTMHAMEDLDFNLRVSGKKREAGGHSAYLCDGETIDMGSGELLRGPTAKAKTLVICKLQQFMFGKEPGLRGGVPKLTDKLPQTCVKFSTLCARQQGEVIDFINAQFANSRNVKQHMQLHSRWVQGPGIPEDQLNKIIDPAEAPNAAPAATAPNEEGDSSEGQDSQGVHGKSDGGGFSRSDGHSGNVDRNISSGGSATAQPVRTLVKTTDADAIDAPNAKKAHSISSEDEVVHTPSREDATSNANVEASSTISARPTFDRLRDVKGIGNQTLKRIKDHFKEANVLLNASNKELQQAANKICRSNPKLLQDAQKELLRQQDRKQSSITNFLSPR